MEKASKTIFNILSHHQKCNSDYLMKKDVLSALRDVATAGRLNPGHGDLPQSKHKLT